MFLLHRTAILEMEETKREKSAVVVRVLSNMQNLVISRCCLAEDGKEMYKDL